MQHSLATILFSTITYNSCHSRHIQLCRYKNTAKRLHPTYKKLDKRRTQEFNFEVCRLQQSMHGVCPLSIYGIFIFPPGIHRCEKSTCPLLESQQCHKSPALVDESWVITVLQLCGSQVAEQVEHRASNLKVASSIRVCQNVCQTMFMHVLLVKNILLKKENQRVTDIHYIAKSIHSDLQIIEFRCTKQEP